MPHQNETPPLPDLNEPFLSFYKKQAATIKVLEEIHKLAWEGELTRDAVIHLLNKAERVLLSGKPQRENFFLKFHQKETSL